MEECMICLEEKEATQFIVFSCKHKTCNECFHLLVMYSTPCPICEQPIIMYIPKQKRIITSNCIEYCKIVSGVTVVSVFIFYIVNFGFQKH
jgi:hypothetical protein